MLAAGKKLGPYEILAPLGAGGMGEVYRARDTRLGRDVAVKVLPLHLTAHPEVRARFEREAKTVSGLNHPNICTLFDVGREGDTDYLVMELVEGETLGQRLAKGALPSAEVLRLGMQIAEALDRAHRAGVIHRDLKPGNIMITRSGAKLMDFGLSRVTGLVAAGSGSSGTGASLAALTQSPTISQPLTAEGTILGTFQYMAPEQLEGKEADARSDIWALGCVLYEMATGRRAFEGRSQASLIAAILEREPPPIGETPSRSGSSPSAGPPQGLDWLIRNCLNKDPDERIQTAHDVKLQLQRIAEASGFSSTGSRIALPAPVSEDGAGVRRRPGLRLTWSIAAAGALIGAAAILAWAWPRLSAPPPTFRFHTDTDLPGARDVVWPRVSPDGRSLVFEATDSSGTTHAWLLRLNETKPNPIPGSEGLVRAYWSPDSREIAFVADQKVQRLSAGGGSPVIVCPAPGGADLSWSSKGMILLDGTSADSLKVVPAAGGELRPATRISRADHEGGTGWPSFLPDGRHFLFLGIRTDGSAGNIRLGRIGSLDSKLIGQSDGRAEYAPGGWVVFVRGNSLVTQKLDLGAGRLIGQPITLADNMRIGASAGNFSVSPSGVLAISPSAGESDFELHLADRKGIVRQPALVGGNLGIPHFSPDGRRILYERAGPGGSPYGDVSVFDLDRGTDTRLTFTDGWAVCSVWSPDGHKFACTRTTPRGPVKVMIGSSDGLGSPDSIDLPGSGAYVSQWAESGSRLTLYSDDGRISYVSLEGRDRAARPLTLPGVGMTHPEISPDGRWLSVVEGNAAEHHVFVQSLQGPPGRWQISSRPGGGHPIWSKGGKELVYESPDGRIMAVDVDTRNGFHAGIPHALFTLPVRSFSRDISSWGCDANAEQFVLVTPGHAPRSGQGIEVLTSFRSLVERK